MANIFLCIKRKLISKNMQPFVMRAENEFQWFHPRMGVGSTALFSSLCFDLAAFIQVVSARRKRGHGIGTSQSQRLLEGAWQSKAMLLEGAKFPLPCEHRT